LALPAAYFALRGGWGDLVEQAWTRNMDYAALVWISGAARSQWVWLFKRLAPELLRGAWPAAALALWGFWGARAGAAEERPGLWAVVWLATALSGAAAGQWFFPHYFLPAMAPLSLAAAAGARRLKSSWAPALLALWPAAAFFGLYFSSPPEAVARALMDPNPLYESRAAGLYLRDRTEPGDSIYVYGSEPQIYRYADRPCATRHIFVYPLTLFPRFAQDIQDELAALAAKAPAAVVYVDLPASTLVATRLGAAFEKKLRDWLEKDYRLSAQAGRLLIYERKDRNPAP
jgi:hypothetical protein